MADTFDLEPFKRLRKQKPFVSNRQNFINAINKLTRKLMYFKVTDSDTREQMRTIRRGLMKQILPFIQHDDKCFLMPYVKPDFYIAPSIALVGNSRNLLNAEYGQVIDAHPTIFRFKFAQIKTHERYTGKREDIRCACLHNLQGKPYHTHAPGLISNYKFYNEFHNMSILTIMRDRYNDPDYFQRLAKNSINMDITTNKFYSLSWQRKQFREILDTTFDLTTDKRIQYGTGILLILTDLGLRPDLFGFDLTLGSQNLGYYWSKIPKPQLSKYHDLNFEQQIIKKLRDMGRIRLYH